MKKSTKMYLRSLLYSFGALIIACLLFHLYGEYKFQQFRNPEHIRKIVDIELPEFKNVETEEDDDYPINHNSYSIWHTVEFVTPLSETAVQKIEQVRSQEVWSNWCDFDGWGLMYPESEYQYEYLDRNALRRLEFKLSSTKAHIYYEVRDSFYWTGYGIFLILFMVLVIIMSLWGLTLFTLYIMGKCKKDILLTNN